MVQKVALLTAGGFAPCLSSAVGGLIERYTELAPEVEIIGYRDGYQGLLLGDFVTVTPTIRAKARPAAQVRRLARSATRRVKLTNAKDCVKRGLVKEGEDPLKVAAERLVADGVDVLHTIGGDDTNTTAADLAAYLAEHDYELTVVGLPKTIDNDVVPIRQSLGADTAAEKGARFAKNVVAEHNASTAHADRPRGHGPQLRLADRRHRPQVPRVARQRGVAAGDRADQGGVGRARRLRARGRLRHRGRGRPPAARSWTRSAASTSSSPRAPASPTSSPRWSRPARRSPATRSATSGSSGSTPAHGSASSSPTCSSAEKVLVQKSGYFSRSAAANAFDLRPDQVDDRPRRRLRARGQAGRHRPRRGERRRARAIEFDRIKGGKPFDITQDWFTELLAGIGQPAPSPRRPPSTDPPSTQVRRARSSGRSALPRDQSAPAFRGEWLSGAEWAGEAAPASSAGRWATRRSRASSSSSVCRRSSAASCGRRRQVEVDARGERDAGRGQDLGAPAPGCRR